MPRDVPPRRSIRKIETERWIYARSSEKSQSRLLLLYIYVIPRVRIVIYTSRERLDALLLFPPQDLESFLRVYSGRRLDNGIVGAKNRGVENNEDVYSVLLKSTPRVHSALHGQNRCREIRRFASFVWRNGPRIVPLFLEETRGYIFGGQLIMEIISGSLAKEKERYQNTLTECRFSSVQFWIFNGYTRGDWYFSKIPLEGSLKKFI